ncbi:MAG TPA: DUF2092 domain-containing protein [Burkholderiaceae bacterium]|nr:DUF2092 domain-containing protein [Burkholderiaceae bacterium]
MKPRSLGRSFALAIALAFSSAGNLALAQQNAQADAPAIEPDAMAALQRMKAALRALNTFSLRAATTIDEVTDDGMKLQFGGTITMMVKRPNGLRAEVDSDRKRRQFIYDGKTFTVYGPRAGGYYASVAAPPTLKAMADAIDSKYGIRLPLTDLFYWAAGDEAVPIKEAALIGPSRIGKVMCDHIAVRQEGLDWQVWIAQGKQALPQKIVITTLSEPSQPQYVSEIQWNTSPKFDANTFKFVAPKGAQPIKIVEIEK